MTVTYRDATVADAEAIDRVFRGSFCATFAHLYRPEDLAAFLAQFTLEAWRNELADPDYAFRLAETDGVVAGYVKLGPVKFPLKTAGPSILLSQLYVLPSHSGAGIGAALVDWAAGEGRRRGNEALYLTVFVDNQRARRFYQRFGFEPVGRYAFMVGDQADEDIIMRKVL